jgi:hypothetical protein
VPSCDRRPVDWAVGPQIGSGLKPARLVTVAWPGASSRAPGSHSGRRACHRQFCRPPPESWHWRRCVAALGAVPLPFVTGRTGGVELPGLSRLGAAISCYLLVVNPRKALPNKGTS